MYPHPVWITDSFLSLFPIFIGSISPPVFLLTRLCSDERRCRGALYCEGELLSSLRIGVEDLLALVHVDHALGCGVYLNGGGGERKEEIFIRGCHLMVSLSHWTPLW